MDPREVLSLFTVRKELQSRRSNLKYGVDLVYYLKSQENSVAMAGLYKDPSPAWAPANQPPTPGTGLQSMLIGDTFHSLIKEKKS